MHCLSIHLALSGLLLCWIVLKQLVDQIDVSHQHAATAVACTAKLVHSHSITVTLFKKLDVAFVEIGHNLGTLLDNGAPKAGY